jgi:hypothetical protein
MNRDIKDRLLDKRIISNNGCWLWQGARFINGYGSIKYYGKTNLVHRLSLEIFRDIKLSTNDNHIRECPNKHCFNPDHLYKGTQTENMTDFGVKCKLCGGPKVKGKRCRMCKMKYNMLYYLNNKA